MKKRNTAIRRIVKCIESEYELKGEFILWETSATAVQKESGIDLQTVIDAFNLLRSLQLFSVHTWSKYTKTFLVGNRCPHTGRLWIPSKVVEPYLVKLPVSPKRSSTKLRYDLVLYQVQLELFRSGMFAYLGKDLDGPEFTPMLPLLISYLKGLKFRQKEVSKLIGRNRRKANVIKLFPEILEIMDSENPKSLGYFVESNDVMEIFSQDEKNIYTIIRSISNNSYNSKRIKSKILKIKDEYEIYKNDRDIFLGSAKTKKKVSDSNTNGEKPLKFKDTPINREKQKILDSFWNARKCLFGVHQTVWAAEGLSTYSPNLPWTMRKAVNIVYQINKTKTYPIPPLKLFTAIIAYYQRTHDNHRPAKTWYGSDAFYELVETFAQAYDELEQFKHGAEQIGDRVILSNEKEQFEVMQKLFHNAFEKTFSQPFDHYFSPHVGFYLDWCIFCAVKDYRIAKTYFEYQTKMEASPLSYIRAQVDYLVRRSRYRSFHLEWIFGIQARARMNVWIQDNEPDGFISRERKEQLNQFFAEQKQKMSNREQA